MRTRLIPHRCDSIEMDCSVGIQRRPVDMQERDFIRESGLASEAMCDLGLTAVNSADILDIMYSDFQPKYEEYCKHQRDRQAKDLTNKQKALTLAVSQEKNNLTEQAVQSAASWNSTFNKVGGICTGC